MQPGPPWQKHLSTKEMALSAINDVRARHNLSLLKMGTNNAPQLHAEEMLEHCFTSHWDTKGRPPHLRFSEQGGQQANAENIFSDNECGYTDTAEHKNPGDRAIIDASLSAFLKSQGHRRTLLDPAYTHASIGIAHDSHTYKVVHHLHTESAKLLRPPAFTPRLISLRAELPATTPELDSSLLYLAISRQPLPRTADPRALRLTACYDTGQPVAAVIPGDEQYGSVTLVSYTPECPSPSAVSHEGQEPGTVGELAALHRTADPGPPKARTNRVVFIKPTTWSYENRTLTVRVNPAPLAETHGEGIYTFVLATTQRDAPPEHRILYQESAVWHTTDLRAH